MRNLKSFMTVALLVVGLGFVASDTQAATSWRTVSKATEVGSPNLANRRFDSPNVSTNGVSRRDPVKIQVKITWQSATGKPLRVAFGWAKVCWNGAPPESPRVVEGGRFVRIDAGSTFTRTWEPKKDFCWLGASAIAKTTDGQTPPPGRLTVAVLDRA